MCSQGGCPYRGLQHNISPVVGWGSEEKKKKKDGGEKLYLRKQWTLMLEWPSDFLQLLSLFRHAVQPAHHFAPAFHLLFVKNATCTLWQVHNPTSHVSCMCSFCGPPFHTIHPTHPAKASGEKRVAQRAANNIPFVTPLRTFTSCDTCAVIICECIRKAVRRLFVMCWHVCVYHWCSRIRSCAYTKCEIKGECVILTSTLYPRLHKYSVLSSCFGSNVTFHPKASRSGQETGRKRESTLSAKRAYHWKVSTSRGELLIVGHFSTLLIYCCSHKRDIYHLNILHVS